MHPLYDCNGYDTSDTSVSIQVQQTHFITFLAIVNIENVVSEKKNIYI